MGTTLIINGLVAITGNTYPVKDQLKKLGGIWNKDMKSWMVPVDKEEQAMEIMDSIPTRNSRSQWDV